LRRRRGEGEGVLGGGSYVIYIYLLAYSVEAGNSFRRYTLDIQGSVHIKKYLVAVKRLVVVVDHEDDNSLAWFPAKELAMNTVGIPLHTASCLSLLLKPSRSFRLWKDPPVSRGVFLVH
jgi:hypothetical protein